MPRKTVTVGSSVGLRDRSAAIISEAAGELDSEVTRAVAGEAPSAEDQIAVLVEKDLDA